MATPELDRHTIGSFKTSARSGTRKFGGRKKVYKKRRKCHLDLFSTIFAFSSCKREYQLNVLVLKINCTFLLKTADKHFIQYLHDMRSWFKNFFVNFSFQLMFTKHAKPKTRLVNMKLSLYYRTHWSCSWIYHIKNRLTRFFIIKPTHPSRLIREAMGGKTFSWKAGHMRKDAYYYNLQWTFEDLCHDIVTQ